MEKTDKEDFQRLLTRLEMEFMAKKKAREVNDEFMY